MKTLKDYISESITLKKFDNSDITKESSDDIMRPWRIVTWRDEYGPFKTEGQAKAFAVKNLSPKGIKYRIEQEKG